MSTSQFTERQKAQMVEAYRAGSSSVAVGKRFGCSDRTVMRLVQSRLGAAELEALKEQNRKRSAPATPGGPSAVVRKDPSASAPQAAGGATGQFTEHQKAQMVEAYRAGSSSVAVGKRFGCSDRTVMRLVRSRLGAAELEALKEQNRKRSAPVTSGGPSAVVRKGSPASAPQTAGGATGQFTERQKAQMVEAYRAGSSSVAVGKRFGCSDRTVMRLVRSRLGAAELEALKEQNRKRSAPVTPGGPSAVVRKDPPPASAPQAAGGATGQFTERQKAQMVEAYRAGSSSVAVGKRFGCSDRTVMRLVRSRLGAAELEALKEQNRKRSAPATPGGPSAVVRKDPPASAPQAAGGATGQFTEHQKAQMVEAYRAGSSSVAVGKRFGCSDRTVMRLVQSRLGAAELEALKEQNRKRSAPATPGGPSAVVRKGSPASAPQAAGGATGQFTERQKAQMVEAYRAGSSSVAVGKRFGCSDRTVMRLVQSRLGAAELEALKEQNRKRSAPVTPGGPSAVVRKDPSASAPQAAGGATGQFTERQKAQMVEAYRAGSSSVAVGKRFGCSDRTVMRLVRSRLGAAELETLKEQNRKRSAPARPAPATPELDPENNQSLAVDEPIDDSVTGPNILPWEDADDFAENGGRDDDGVIEDDDTTLSTSSHPGTSKAAKQSTGVTRAINLDVNQLPSPLYLVVERSVELQPQTLGSLHHLGPLDADEQQRQGLILFSNVRQARRQCRRNQRVVKVADPKLLGKTAPHLLAQGISRLVIESNLYALPSSVAAAQP